MTGPVELSRADGAALRRVGALRIAADLLWPVQAWAVAAVIAGWLQGAALPAGWLALFAATGALRALLQHRAGRIAFDLGQEVVARARRRLLDRQALRLDAPLSSAELAALAADKIPLLAPYVTRFRLAMLRVRIVPAALAFVVATQSWAAALVLLVAGPLIPVFMALVGLAAKEASARQMVEIGAVNRLLVDRIAALPDLRLLEGFDRARRDLADRLEALRRATMAVLRVAFLSSTVLELFAALGVAMVAVYVGFSLLGELGFGTWGAPLTLQAGLFVLLLAPDYFQPLRDLAAAWHDKAAAEAVAAELAALAADPGQPILGTGDAAPPLSGPATILMTGARAGRGAARVALPDLRLGPGESLALTGPSGSGKSTALDALAGLLPLSAGRIEVAGRLLDAAAADAWRARIAVIPQQVWVPEARLREMLDPRGTGADPGPALAALGLDAVVAALPDGLDTRLGETGAGVSGGEARRLLLARALLSRAEVILADEPTADLDAATAGRIVAALRAAQAEGCAVIVASHDPRLIAAMDRRIDLPGVAA